MDLGASNSQILSAGHLHGPQTRDRLSARSLKHNKAPYLRHCASFLPATATEKFDFRTEPVSKRICGGCRGPISDRYLLKAMDRYWHEDCLKCACCECRLGEVGSTLYTKANLILCKRDYLRLFGAQGMCALCCKTILGFEMVMRARQNVYHLECFSCQRCNQRFCVGDKFGMVNNKILCVEDYEDVMAYKSKSKVLNIR